MNNQSHKNKPYWRMGVSLSLVMLMLTIPLQAETDQKSFCSASSGLFNHGRNNEFLSQNFWSEVDNISIQFKEKENKERLVGKNNRIFQQMFLGILGSISPGVLLGTGVTFGIIYFLAVISPDLSEPLLRTPIAASLLALPSIGATIFFNRSLSPRYSLRPKALFNMSSKKIKMDFPHVQVKALPNFKNRYRPVLRFNVRVLSFEL